MSQKSTLHFLMGPTASGKTALSLALANHFPLEIISVDSAMIYRGMDIGTGKPKRSELQKVPHHLIDIRNPDETYSAGEFCEDVTRIIPEILERGRIPLLVGGTMLYFHALQFGLSDLPKGNTALRAQLLKEIADNGLESLYQRLQKVDPLYAKKIKSTDSQRIQRALEVFEVSGKPLSDFFTKKTTFLEPYSVKTWALAPSDRGFLHEWIQNRFHQMLEEGLVEEVKQFMHLSPQLPSMRSVGYRQVLAYLKGTSSYEDMVNKAIFATRQLAKRQLTWLRSWPHVEWLREEPSPIMQMGQFFSKGI